MPSDVGATMDVAGAVKAAMGVSRDGNIFGDIGTRWKLYFSKRDLSLTGEVDDAKMQTFVAGHRQGYRRGRRSTPPSPSRTARSRSSTACRARWSTRPLWPAAFRPCW